MGRVDEEEALQAAARRAGAGRALGLPTTVGAGTNHDLGVARYELLDGFDDVVAHLPLRGYHLPHLLRQFVRCFACEVGGGGRGGRGAGARQSTYPIEAGARQSTYPPRVKTRTMQHTTDTAHTGCGLGIEGVGSRRVLAPARFRSLQFPSHIITHNAPHPKPSPDVLFPGFLGSEL